MGQSPWSCERGGRRLGIRGNRRQGAPGHRGAGLQDQHVLCSNDRLAIGVLSPAYERGLRVGRGPGCALRVASHDDHPFSRFTCPVPDDGGA
jgi:hypothetical protein